jgi:mercuric reductase
MTPRGQFYAAVAGTVVVALCCFTPVLVIALAAIGLGALTEPALAQRLTEIPQGERITVITNAAVQRASRAGGKKVVTYVAEGDEKQVAADESLLAAGKKPNTVELGLERAGVTVDGRGAIRVQLHMQTSLSLTASEGEAVVAPASVSAASQWRGAERSATPQARRRARRQK